MAEVELIMPKMGESIMEATILKWLKNVGDNVAVDEPVLEIATDKVDSEVPSTHAGKLAKILFQVNDVVPVGKVIAILETDAAAAIKPLAVVPEMPKTAEVKSPIKTDSKPVSNEARFYSPLVLNIARSEGISMSVLDTIPGTGEGGRVTKRDILAFVQKGGAENIQTVAPEIEKPVEPVAPVINVGGNVEIIEMDRMRKLIADHMVMSKRTSAHVTSFVEADVTNLVLWRERIKSAFEKREGEKITFTPLFIEAVVKALKEYPLVNSSVNGSQIIRKKDINIGMAAAMPSGNLIVPVIKNADTKNLVGLTKEVNDLARRARAGQLKPTEIEGGTFTLTNVGTFGNLMGTPIINQPQVAIMATGAIKKKPAVLETSQGDVIAIRHMMFLSLSYDHRIVDGALGGSFLRKVADNMEAFDPKREF
ncbi:MAG: 2-oxo acid dehydrogenase subunit E2 [Chitinophagales bacterium]|nr:2-oxo acid dehydrogenase subunit E2 [Chitinophagales bacterium]